MCPFVKNTGLVVPRPTVTISAAPVVAESKIPSMLIDPSTSWPPIDYGPVVKNNCSERLA